MGYVPGRIFFKEARKVLNAQEFGSFLGMLYDSTRYNRSLSSGATHGMSANQINNSLRPTKRCAYRAAFSVSHTRNSRIERVEHRLGKIAL